MSELHFHIHVSKKLLRDANASIHIHISEEGVASYSGRVRRSLQRSGSSGSSQMALSALTAGQRIRPKFYAVELVPETKQERSQRSGKKNRYNQFGREAIKLELSSGNQRDPITWESFAPDVARGLWRFTVRRDFDRMIGVLTFARDSSAMWIVSEWTPKGCLVLDPVRPGVDPKIMLKPVAS